MIVLTRRQCADLERYMLEGGNTDTYDRVANHTIPRWRKLAWKVRKVVR